MALRHAVLAALLDGESSGYRLAKVFDVGVANFWYAAPQQLYGELTKLEADGLVAGRHVAQQGRPDKRVYRVTEAGLAELAAFAAAPPKPLLIRDDLVVRVHASDHLDPEPIITQLEERARAAEARLDIFERTLVAFRGGLDEETFLREGALIGPYLTCLGGCRLESQSRDWCRATAAALRARSVTVSR